uniref:Cytochrome P450 2U1-like n=1 Tax=Phallusia mammillata TaxID=59560 RepID=A0A6F9DB62_9ASCI|nr:cytochrome P450 2U1-like [Phallusia mammillata]
METWWAVVYSLCALCMAWLWSWWKKPHPKFPPGPRGLPIVGMAPFLGPEPQITFKKLGEKYGPVMSVRMGMKDIVVLNTYEVINQAYVKQANEFSGRQDFFVYKQVTQDYGVMFKDYSDEYKRQKNFGTQALKRHGMSKAEMEKQILYESDFLMEKLRKQSGSPINIVPVLYQSAGNVVASIVLGKRFEDNDPTFLLLLKTLKTIFANKKIADSIMMMMLFENLRYIPPFSTTNQTIKEQLQILSDIFQKIVDDKNANFKQTDVNNFMDAFINEKRHGAGKIDSSFTDEQLVVFARDIFSAGTETVSSNIGWAIICLLHHPKYKQLLKDEIKDCLGRDGQPSLSIKDHLPMTCAFLQEVLRFRIVAPMVHHKTNSDAVLYGYVIPKGTQVTANLHGAAWDKETWPQPEVFNPERHIDEEGKFVFSPKIIAFSIGPRFCMGESLGRAEVFLVFVSLLQHFDISSVNGLPSLQGCSTNIVYTPQDFEIMLTPL